MTTWRAIPFAPHYEISDCGLIRSTAKRWKAGPRIITQTLTNAGYPHVVLTYGGKPHGHNTHRLVAMVFLGESPLEVNHKNGNKLDNRADNLEWSTRLHNVHHFLAGQKKRWRPNAKLDVDMVKAIRAKHASGQTMTAIAKEYGVSIATISMTVNNKQWID